VHAASATRRHNPENLDVILTSYNLVRAIWFDTNLTKDATRLPFIAISEDVKKEEILTHYRKIEVRKNFDS